MLLLDNKHLDSLVLYLIDFGGPFFQRKTWLVVGPPTTLRLMIFLIHVMALHGYFDVKNRVMNTFSSEIMSGCLQANGGSRARLYKHNGSEQ